MNIWDSVQRGLEKASNEAARIAKGQRLRASLEKFSRQITAQEQQLLATSMDLLSRGTLIQPELIPLCQELLSLHQQVQQAQLELQQLSQNTPSTPAAAPTSAPPSTPTLPTVQESIPPTLLAQSSSTPYGTEPFQLSGPAIPPPPPPPYQQPDIYAQSSGTIPPPPPGASAYTPAPAPAIHEQETRREEPALPQSSTLHPLTISSQETRLDPPPPPAFVPEVADQGTIRSSSNGSQERLICRSCGMLSPSGTHFCQHCGSLLQTHEREQQPTIRASATLSAPEQETIRASETEEQASQSSDSTTLPDYTPLDGGK
ncbi:hypothetical protein [Tengunoibacter tsumagoiensis]|uniref:Zinc-ribbon domain-containing protein n=1 Tax=Tengunoibacter tsumagoiensis TaxID=2014871 RepID=A0A402A2V9_9CHLR|nr:hypothetical protein [Tengunoibacter tsumagoiensis]GCE13477.1 hypothetical protein KTT_33360 [Tengunoibacter tsumagoiensis]